jgi:hypothetical protein
MLTRIVTGYSLMLNPEGRQCGVFGQKVMAAALLCPSAIYNPTDAPYSYIITKYKLISNK